MGKRAKIGQRAQPNEKTANFGKIDWPVSHIFLILILDGQIAKWHEPTGQSRAEKVISFFLVYKFI